MTVAYRADLDGLRALAVLLVVFNHLGWSLFSGGYIGVDVFFVISGYLITSILRQDIEQQRFSIAKFYQKRVLRLAPAYFLMLGVVSVFAWHVMLPDELVKYVQSALHATFLMGNIYMQNEVGDYFSPTVETIPLLHLWSLGVEEQFYILWPLVLLLLLKKTSSQWRCGFILIAIISSLIYADYRLDINANKAYYSMWVRAFELLLGALLVFLPQLDMQARVRQLGVWGAFLALILTATIFDENTPFPGLMALIPCLATASIIYLGTNSTRQHPILQHRLSVWIGKISYPLYLWHWPVIVLAGFYLIPASFTAQMSMLLLSLLLAWLTYRYVEQPSRRFASVKPWKVILIGFMLPAIGFAGFSYITTQQQGFMQRLSASEQQQLKALNHYAHTERKACHNLPGPDQLPSPEQCQLGVRKAEVDVLLVGDSHANSYTAMLDVWAKDADLRLYDISQDSTAYLPGLSIERSSLQWREDSRFERRNQAITAHLAQQRYRYIVLAGAYHGYFNVERVKLNQAESYTQNRAAFLEGLKAAVAQASQASQQVILLVDVPELSQVKANCSLRRALTGLDGACAEPVAKVRADAAEFMQVVSEIQQQFPQLRVVDPTRVICDDIACQVSVDGVPLYRHHDRGHLNYAGAQALGHAYLAQFNNPLRD